MPDSWGFTCMKSTGPHIFPWRLRPVACSISYNGTTVTNLIMHSAAVFDRVINKWCRSCSGSAVANPIEDKRQILHQIIISMNAKLHSLHPVGC